MSTLYKRWYSVSFSSSPVLYEADELEATETKTVVITSPLRVAFSVKTDITPTPNTATIKLYNLTEATSKSIVEKGRVKLEAGYEETHGTIFKGDIVSVTTERSGADMITTVIAHDGIKQSLNTIQVSISGSASFNTVVLAVLSAINKDDSGISVAGASAAINALPDVPGTYPRGFSDKGAGIDVLNNVLKKRDLAAFILSDTVVLTGKTNKNTNHNLILDSSSGLIGSPSLKGKDKDKDGKEVTGVVKCESLLRHALQPGRIGKVTIASKTPHQGIYSINSVTHKGDSRGSDWTSELELSKV